MKSNVAQARSGIREMFDYEIKSIWTNHVKIAVVCSSEIFLCRAVFGDISELEGDV